MSEILFHLRIIGFLIGAGFILNALNRKRKRDSYLHPSDCISLISGLGLILISIYPDILNWVTSLINLNTPPYGRLVALLILSQFATAPLIISLFKSSEKTKGQLDLLTRALVFKSISSKDLESRKGGIHVVIPVLNEHENLEILLPSLPHTLLGKNCYFTIIDDGSNDGSNALTLPEHVMMINVPFTRGGGAALRLGFDVSKHCEAEVIGTMDGDGQHLPQELARLVEPILNSKADIVIGSRRLGSTEQSRGIRTLGVYLYSGVLSFLTGAKITDSSNGFRAFNLKVLDSVQLRQDQYHTAEFVIDARLKGCQIMEVPVTIKARLHGESKKGVNLLYGIHYLRVIVKTWILRLK